MWLGLSGRDSGKQSQLLKLKPGILSLRFLTANTLDGSILQKWLSFYKVSITFKFQKFTKHEGFFVVCCLFVCLQGNYRRIVSNVRIATLLLTFEQHEFKLHAKIHACRFFQ